MSTIIKANSQEAINYSTSCKLITLDIFKNFTTCLKINWQYIPMTVFVLFLVYTFLSFLHGRYCIKEKRERRISVRQSFDGQNIIEMAEHDDICRQVRKSVVSFVERDVNGRSSLMVISE